MAEVPRIGEAACEVERAYRSALWKASGFGPIKTGHSASEKGASHQVLLGDQRRVRLPSATGFPWLGRVRSRG